MKFILLTRDEFRQQVFIRDNYKCVVCKSVAKDSHHILERRLWINGGYYLENGVSVCEEHHLAAEETTLSCDELRNLAGINSFPIPEHLYADQPYDKWGNPILPNGMRIKGELFDDISVQKIIKPVLHLFTDRIKYPRTYHLPWSPGLTKDDRVMQNLNKFENSNIVITAKMDGENTTFYSDYIHARSIEYNPHPSRSWVKSLHARIAHDIPKGWRICGENLYAQHSIKYENLEDYFQLFSIWNEKNICLNWKETLVWAELLGLKVVPVLYSGIWDEKLIRNLYQSQLNGDPCEGYVVRIFNEFHYRDFRNCVGKFVRAGHIAQHGGHWIRSQIKPNKLK